jgi:hypothetical protein
MHNYFLIEHNYSQSAIYNFKSEIKFRKNYNVVKKNYCNDCNFRNYYKIIYLFIKKIL